MPTARQQLVLYASVLHGPKEAAHRLERSESLVKMTVERMRNSAGAESIEQLVYIGAACGWLTVPELDRRCRGRRRKHTSTPG